VGADAGATETGGPVGPSLPFTGYNAAAEQRLTGM
jgi:hypothetical protein